MLDLLIGWRAGPAEGDAGVLDGVVGRWEEKTTIRAPPILISFGVIIGMALGGSIVAGLELTFPKAQVVPMDQLSPLLRFWH